MFDLVFPNTALVSTRFIGWFGVLLSILGPFHRKDQVIVTISIHGINSLKNKLHPRLKCEKSNLLSIITISVIDKGETTGLISTTITTQMNTIDSAEFLEKLRKIFLGCSGRNVWNSDCWNLKFIKITCQKVIECTSSVWNLLPLAPARFLGATYLSANVRREAPCGSG